MIHKLLISDPERTPIEWWPKVDAFRGKSSFAFGPGLNVLWGPNGSGKSTLLRLLARLTHCEQGGVPKVTKTSLSEFRGRRSSDGHDLLLDGVALEADGQPVHFFDPTRAVGLLGGGFDDDFFAEGMQYSLHGRKTSSGQQVTQAFARILHSATTLSSVPWQAHKPATADRDFATKWIVPEGSPGLRTVLLDEPDRSLSMTDQLELWKTLAQQNRFQLIVATHSVFALHLLGATYHDVQEGSLRSSRKAIHDWIAGFIQPHKVSPA